MKATTTTTRIFTPPEMSDWVCYLFGNRPGGTGITYRPRKSTEPHWLARWLMLVCFDCLWVKQPHSTGGNSKEKT